MTTDYSSEWHRKNALKALNGGEGRITELQKTVKEVEKILHQIRMDIIYTRRVVYGAGQGKTGRSFKKTN